MKMYFFTFHAATMVYLLFHLDSEANGFMLLVAIMSIVTAVAALHVRTEEIIKSQSPKAGEEGK